MTRPLWAAIGLMLVAMAMAVVVERLEFWAAGIMLVGLGVFAVAAVRGRTSNGPYR